MPYRDSMVIKRIEKRLGRPLNAEELDHVDHDEGFEAYDLRGELCLFTVPIYTLQELLPPQVSNIVDEQVQVSPWA